MQILALPVELQTQILSELPWHDHFHIAQVCTLWASILQHHGLRTRRHYNHPIPAGWDIVEHQYPVYNAPTPRVSPHPDLYTPTNGPNTHVLLEQAILMLEIESNGRTTVCIKLPREYTDSDGSLLLDREVVRVMGSGTTTDTERAQYSDFWQAVCPADAAMIDITGSPLLSSDKLIFSIKESEGDYTGGIHIPGIPDGPRVLAFTLWSWVRDPGLFGQPDGTPSGLELNDPAWAKKLWDWPSGSPAGLVETIREHLRTHVFCSESVVQTCFVQVAGFNIYGDNPGETINVFVAMFPRAAAAAAVGSD